MEKVKEKQDMEQRMRYLKNVDCVDVSDTLYRTKVIQDNINKDFEEFSHNVLHRGMYNTIGMKPMTEMPEDGNL